MSEALRISVSEKVRAHDSFMRVVIDLYELETQKVTKKLRKIQGSHDIIIYPKDDDTEYLIRALASYGITSGMIVDTDHVSQIDEDTVALMERAVIASFSVDQDYTIYRSDEGLIE